MKTSQNHWESKSTVNFHLAVHRTGGALSEPNSYLCYPGNVFRRVLASLREGEFVCWSVRRSVHRSQTSWISANWVEFEQNSIRNMKLYHQKENSEKSTRADRQNASVVWTVSFVSCISVRGSVCPLVRRLQTNWISEIWDFPVDLEQNYIRNIPFKRGFKLREQNARTHLLSELRQTYLFVLSLFCFVCF